MQANMFRSVPWFNFERSKRFAFSWLRHLSVIKHKILSAKFNFIIILYISSHKSSPVLAVVCFISRQRKSKFESKQPRARILSWCIEVASNVSMYLLLPDKNCSLCSSNKPSTFDLIWRNQLTSGTLKPGMGDPGIHRSRDPGIQAGSPRDPGPRDPQIWKGGIRIQGSRGSRDPNKPRGSGSRDPQIWKGGIRIQGSRGSGDPNQPRGSRDPGDPGIQSLDPRSRNQESQIWF